MGSGALTVSHINAKYFVTSPVRGKYYAYGAFTSETIARAFAAMLERDYDVIGMSRRLAYREMTGEDFICWKEITRRAKHPTAVIVTGTTLYEQMYTL